MRNPRELPNGRTPWKCVQVADDYWTRSNLAQMTPCNDLTHANDISEAATPFLSGKPSEKILEPDLHLRNTLIATE